MSQFFNSIPWYAWIPILAIVCWALVELVKAFHRHDERMAMIKQGMDPSKTDDEK